MVSFSHNIFSVCFVAGYLKSQLLQKSHISLLSIQIHRRLKQRSIHTNRNLIVINVKVKLFLSWLGHSKSPNYRLIRNEYQIFDNIIWRQMSRHWFDVISTIEFHLIFSAILFNLLVYMFLSPFNYRITNLIATLNAKYWVCWFFSPYFQTGDLQVGSFAD